MSRVIAHTTLWTLRRGDQSIRAEMREIERIGAELRYFAGTDFLNSRLFAPADRDELLAVAAVKKQELQDDGWREEQK